MRLFLGVEQRLFLAGFRIALGILDDPERLLFGAADRLGGDPLPVGKPCREQRGSHQDRDDNVDQISEYRQHA